MCPPYPYRRDGHKGMAVMGPRWPASGFVFAIRSIMMSNLVLANFMNLSYQTAASKPSLDP
jgi:hypothetical protein